jgi:hypothetical protein
MNFFKPPINTAWMFTVIVALLASRGAFLPRVPRAKLPAVRAALLSDSSPAGEMIGVVAGFLIWIGLLGFTIVYYVIKCKCLRCCKRAAPAELHGAGQPEILPSDPSEVVP